MTRKRLFNHPQGLIVLFLSAMWEMFALFGMRAVLIYYLVKGLRFDQPFAVEVYSLSNAAMFLAALAGGYFADRVFGLRRAAIGGALVMATGFFLLMQPSLLYVALAVIALGNGLYKPTMWSQVGLLYANDDGRRERGYIIFHVGNNLGAIAAPFVCGWLGEAYGWDRAFAVCGAGMLISAGVVFFGRSGLMAKAEPAAAEHRTAAPVRSLRYNLALIVAAWFVAVLFWLAYNQIGSTFALWVDQSVARTISLGKGGFTIPAAWFQAINPMLVFLLAPLVNWGWARETAVAGATRDLRKMAVGAVVLATAFLILAAAAANPAASGKVSALWVVLAIIPYTLGELMLPPVTASLFTRLAPVGYATIFMSFFFLAQMAGSVAASAMGYVWKAVGPSPFFVITALIALAGAALALVARSAFASSDKLAIAALAAASNAKGREA
jgi:POT family proton-dependent oligopeptide transporter